MVSARKRSDYARNLVGLGSSRIRPDPVGIWSKKLALSLPFGVGKFLSGFRPDPSGSTQIRSDPLRSDQIQWGTGKTSIPLNFYLKRIGKIESDKCLKCNENCDNVQLKESINHYIYFFECQEYHEARQSLIGKIGRSGFTMPKIMKNADNMKALVMFINRMKRFTEDN
jgi:hypothetical protein